MLITKKVKIKLFSTNIKHYLNKGFNFKIGETHQISVWDLPPKSHEKVKIKCDYCKKEIVEKEWHLFLKSREKINKDACFKCRHLKEQEICQLRYGVDSVLSLPNVQEKGKETRKEKYGEEVPCKNTDIVEKMKKTNLEKYGVDNPLKSKEIREKIKKTNLEKYGVENPLQSGPFRDSFKEKMYLNKSQKGIVPASKPQRFLCELYEGKLNQYIGDFYIVDILFEDLKIYCEYNGGGHRLPVILGQLTEKDFNRREDIRYFSLKKMGYKLFKITNESHERRDKLPDKETLLFIKDIALYYLSQEDCNYINFNFDNQQIQTKQLVIKCNFDKGITVKKYNNIIKKLTF